jgi:hypothetical protein
VCHRYCIKRACRTTPAEIAVVRKCQAQARERWLEARQQELLDTGFFHVVFTVPHELNPLALENPARFYHLLFSARSQTLLEIAADPKYLGAEIGFLSILHTWGQNVLAIHIPTASFLPAACLRTTSAASILTLVSCYRFRCSAPSSARSSSLDWSTSTGTDVSTAAARQPLPGSGTTCRVTGSIEAEEVDRVRRKQARSRPLCDFFFSSATPANRFVLRFRRREAGPEEPAPISRKQF